MPRTSDDRTQPRDLTDEELWEAWSIDPDWHDDLWKKFVFPYIISTVRTLLSPRLTPPLRYSYALVSPAKGFQQLVMRKTKYAVFSTIMQAIPDAPHVYSLFRQKGEWERVKKSVVDMHKIIGVAETKKEKGNKEYRSRDVENALIYYTMAWLELLPWHAAAFSPADPMRTRFSKCETAILVNLSAVLVAMAKAGNHRGFKGRDEMEIMAYMCAWCALEDREQATASTVRNACHRLQDTINTMFKDCTTFLDKRAEMIQYHKKQAEALEGVPMDVMYRDVEERRKITPPPEWVYHLFGSWQWMAQLRVGPHKPRCSG
ncbi:hypothetical protein IAT38_003126 [Cryptococcus sp. DSM 104549]